MRLSWPAILCAGLGVLRAAPLAAQTLHQHPQKAAYASAAEWLPVSAQCHWTPSPSIGHTHLELLGAPIYGEIDGQTTWSLRVRVMLFHTAGVNLGVWGNAISSIVWDDTGTSTPPNMVGDPNGLRMWTATVTVNLAAAMAFSGDGAFQVPPKGWFPFWFKARTIFDNGDRMDVELRLPVFSMRDANATETGTPDVHAFRTTALCIPRSSAGEALAGGPSYAGFSFTEILDYLPVAPISNAVPIHSYTYNYAGDNRLLPGSFYEQRLDPDFHNGISGSVLIHTAGVGSGQGQQTLNYDTIDPVAFGTGPHKLMWFWAEPTGAGVSGAIPAGEEVDSILVIPIMIDPNAPSTPSLAGAPEHDFIINNNFPPPSTPVVQPPPPPMEMWHQISVEIWRLGDSVKLCDPTDAKCVVLGNVQ